MQVQRFFWLTGLGLALSLTPGAFADPLVELKIDKTVFQGRSVAHDKSWCWLEGRAGELRLIDLGEVTSYRKLGDSFRADGVLQVTQALKREVPKAFDVQSRGNYVVCAPRDRAELYAELFHEVSAHYAAYFNRKGWRLPPPEFPLIVMVHATKAEFDEQCREDGLTPSNELQGYYHPLSNRVSLFDQPAVPGAKAELSRSTAVHEGIHQLSFNQGLHSRISPNPRWLVEGLATMLEAGALEAKSGQDSSVRINDARLSRFREFNARRRKHTVANFLTTDEQLYSSAPLDFYSEAWALTFFLAETRRNEYVKYLQAVAHRENLDRDYSATKRVEDFQKAFGKDLPRLEVQFQRFMGDLE